MRENVDLHRFWILLASAVVLVLLSSVSMAAVITVDDDDGTKNYETIQYAVNNASSGDTILVYPGTYNENVDGTAALHVDSDLNDLNITSVGGASVTNVTTDADYLFYITSDNVTINGFNVSGTVYLSGIYLAGANNCTLTNNIITNIKNQPGVLLTSSENNTLSNNVVFGNNGGIYLKSNSNNNNLTGNDVSDNLNHGIFLHSNNGNKLIDNTILDNEYKGIYLYSSGSNNLTQNKVSGNNNGIYLEDDSDDNELINNTILDNENFGIHLVNTQYISNNINLKDNKVINNKKGINIGDSFSNNLINNNVSSNTDYGIRLFSSHENRLIGNIVLNNDRGIYLDTSKNNDFVNNTISENAAQGIYLYACNGNNFYNNYFNNSNNVYIKAYKYILSNNWNTTNTTGPNIIGGPYIGGNFWATPDGTGFSQVNTDSDEDGFCDTPNDNYKISEGYEQYDYLPLVSTVADDEPPVVVPIAPLGKEVGTGELLELNVSVTDDSDISSVVVNVSSVNDTVDTAFLTNVNGYWVNNSITLDVNPHGEYNLSINATDEFGNSNTSMNLSVIGESTSTGDGNEDDGGSPVYHPQPLFDVPTANPLLLVGVLGIVVMFFVRRRE